MWHVKCTHMHSSIGGSTWDQLCNRTVQSLGLLEVVAARQCGQSRLFHCVKVAGLYPLAGENQCQHQSSWRGVGIQAVLVELV